MIRGYKELIVWQKAMELVEVIYRLMKKFPADERFRLCDQLSRAVVSIPSNIAEGRGRQTDNDFRHFLFIAKGSCYELETQLLICVRQCYLTNEDVKAALSLSDEVSRMLTSLIKTLS